MVIQKGKVDIDVSDSPGGDQLNQHCVKFSVTGV